MRILITYHSDTAIRKKMAQAVAAGARGCAGKYDRHRLSQGLCRLCRWRPAMGWGPYARTNNHEGMPEGITDAQLVATRPYGAHVAEIAERLFDN